MTEGAGVVPIYRIAQDSGDVVMDLTVDVGFQDFGFRVENADRASAVTVRVYHTDEIRLFCQLLAVAVADRSATSAVANIERELRRICVGMKPSEQGEHRLHEAEHTWK
ncbi:hypothetical protein, partial [Branchiibius sp. NY16-3462-2]|uniref:hypothetical protein n=1 Tax=Branchiibius sp. NY16-3462-2 TaxID=1807500 RepID=UPI0025BEB066